MLPTFKIWKDCKYKSKYSTTSRPLIQIFLAQIPLVQAFLISISLAAKRLGYEQLEKHPEPVNIISLSDSCFIVNKFVKLISKDVDI